MSAGAHTVRVAPRFARSSPAAPGERSEAARLVIRLATFAGLALYGVVRWATLISPAPTARLLGLFALAVALAGGVPALQRVGRTPALALAIALCLLALPVAGLPWDFFAQERVAVSAREIGNGLAGLPTALVPYSGASHAVRLVIALGAAVLLLDAAMVMAFAPRAFGDARRAGAALPLLALAVVPSTLVRPQLPYLQGLVLFALLAAFMWGERVRRGAAGTALVLAALAGMGAAIAAPRIDQHKPWLDYRAWAGTLVRVKVDSFQWNQRYGPLHWPREGHVVMTVTARRGDYWKAEDLDVFNGTDWVSGSAPSASPPSPESSEVARWSQTIRVRIGAMRTEQVIASGFAQQPIAVPGGVEPGEANGTWLAQQPLGPGATYEVSTYSPHPTEVELASAGNDYPNGALGTYRTLAIPQSGLPHGASPQVTFPPFHSASPPSMAVPFLDRNATRSVTTSPYAGAYALARRLAAGAATPYAFVIDVERYLSSGYTYNENPPLRRYPLASFLFRDKIGYCQQFSGAMALLLRMGGVPARVAAGFTSGTRDPATGQWVVTDIDAHAWDEVWFPRYGWVRFDPTPAVAPARGGSALEPILKKLTGEHGGAPTAPRRDFHATPHSASVAGHAAGGGASPLWLVPVLAALGALAWLLRGLLRGEPSPDEQLLELERALARTGRPLAGGVTLAALEHRFRDSPAAAGYVRALRLARYGATGVPPSPAARRALREQLRQGLGMSGRMRALWALPPRPRTTARRRHRALRS